MQQISITASVQTTEPLWEWKLVQPLWKAVWRFLWKLKIELLYDPAIPLLGIYLEKTLIQKDTSTPLFLAALFTIAKTWKQPKCPSTDEQIKMYVCVCVCVCVMEYYSAIKNEIVQSAPTWMDLEIIIQVRQRQISYDITYMWNLNWEFGINRYNYYI